MDENVAIHRSKDGLRKRRPSPMGGERGGNGERSNETPNPEDAGSKPFRVDSVTDASSSETTLLRPLPRDRRNQKIRSVGVALSWIVHLTAIACFVYGIILRTRHLHTGDECDMTYSWRVFFQVETIPGTKAARATRGYGLYKFVDHRDPRHQAILQRHNQQQKRDQTTPLGRREHCGTPSHTTKHIVVYVPGHWGSYEQARSLGAHGIGMTRMKESSANLQKLQRRLVAASTGNTNSSSGTLEEHDLVYDVYAVDFAEQGGALHGQFLRYQSDFLASALQQLTEDCGFEDNNHGNGKSHIVVVAHSMGGYVARRVLLEHPELPVDNLITLATPHANPLYAFDRSVRDFHRGMLLETRPSRGNSTTSPPVVVSVSGGLRDEMIEPSACWVSEGCSLKSATAAPISSSSSWLSKLSSSRSLWKDCPSEAHHSWTLSATRFLTFLKHDVPRGYPNPLLGMDHRAIVWCHQLLEEVRTMLWALMASSERPASERIDRVREASGVGSRMYDPDFSEDLRAMHRALRSRFGSWSAVCMESSMIYNLPYLLAMYALLVGFRCARWTPLERSTSFLPVWATVCLGWIVRSDLHWCATIVVVLVANSVNLALVHLLPVGFLWRRCVPPKRPLRTLGDALVGTLAAVIGIAVTILLCVSLVCQFVPRLEHHNFVAYVFAWRNLWDSVLYTGAIAAMYAKLIVWAGFLNSKPNGESSFEIQLITFVMMVVPFLVAGPVVLMVWEQQTRPSSWWTLLSLQVPVGILTSVKLGKMEATETNDNIATNRQLESMPLVKQLRARSIMIYLSILFLCCREEGLLSRGTGYLVPIFSISLVWIDIASSSNFFSKWN